MAVAVIAVFGHGEQYSAGSTAWFLLNDRIKEAVIVAVPWYKS